MGQTFKHFVRYHLGLEPAQTQTTELERTALSRYAADRRRLVEIGVFEGFTTAILARAMSEDGVLYAIDPFFGGRLGVCWSKWIAKREVARARCQGRIEFMETFSHDAVTLIEGEFDFVFVDGDHSLEAIRSDWADWSKRISPAGIIALHDTRVPAHNPTIAELGSYQYFESHIKHDPRFELLEQVDSLSVLRRRKTEDSETLKC